MAREPEILLRILWITAFAWMAFALPAAAKEVALDVGHSIATQGALSARGVPEFEYNLALAGEARAALERAGLGVRVIGAAGDTQDLASRPRLAKGADLFISIHHDSIKERLLQVWQPNGEPQRHNDSVSGFSLFVSRENPRFASSLACASAIGRALRAAGFVPSRYHADPVLGESREFADEPNGVHFFDRLAVLRHAAMPALLFEAGVIVNRVEELRMREPGVKRAIADALVQGVRECLN
ncbi:MAG: N-acetylmuramoyl-L-alanine amidase [Betaproteobacteria bacterium]|nr:N-acetylmuramoyl-L-alanine amidase [Betaproteobacteria bacterium]